MCFFFREISTELREVYKETNSDNGDRQTNRDNGAGDCSGPDTLRKDPNGNICHTKKIKNLKIKNLAKKKIFLVLNV